MNIKVAAFTVSEKSSNILTQKVNLISFYINLIKRNIEFVFLHLNNVFVVSF